MPPVKGQPQGERRSEPSFARKAIKLGLAMHLLKTRDRDGLEGVREDLSDTPRQIVGKGRPRNIMTCGFEEAQDAINASDAILDDMDFR